VVLVVGASRGIGLELVRQLVAKGDFVLAACRNVEKAGPVLNDLLKDGASGSLVSLDVADEKSIAEAAQAVEKTGKKIDLLIINAGVLPDSFEKIATAKKEHMLYAYEINVVGPLLITQKFLPLLVSIFLWHLF